MSLARCIRSLHQNLPVSIVNVFATSLAPSSTPPTKPFMSYLEMNISDSDEEEEEEMMFLVPALYLLSKKTRIPMNTSILTGPKYIQELLDGHPTRCYDVLRILNFKMLRSVKCNRRCVR